MSKSSDAGWILIFLLLLPVIVLVFLGGWLKADVFGSKPKRKDR